LEEPLDKGKLVGVYSSRRRGKEVLKKKKKIATATSRDKKGKKGKYSLAEYFLPRSNSNIVYLARNQPSQRFILTCHHCGKIGHIRPNCFQLNNHE
jgi:hypothetical protein